MRVWMTLGLLGCASDPLQEVDPDTWATDCLNTSSHAVLTSFAADQRVDVERTYDAHGREILRSIVRDDGPPETVRWEWGEHGPAIRERDLDDDGVVDHRLAYTYADGLQVEQLEDRGADGTWDASLVWVWDGDRRIEEHEDEQNDGRVDRIRFHLYDGALHVQTVTDRGADGSTDDRTTFVYEDGHVVREEVDRGADGVLDGIVHRTWRDGLLTQVEQESDGVLWERTRYTYDARGNRTEEATDLDLDGVDDWIVTYEWSCVSEPREPLDR